MNLEPEDLLAIYSLLNLREIGRWMIKFIVLYAFWELCVLCALNYKIM